jgi:glycosyltransferase involved in cell wall biosynthesis
MESSIPASLLKSFVSPASIQPDPLKYPITLLYRKDNYHHIDDYFKSNKEKLLCSITITSDKNDLLNLFDSSNHLLLTFGNNKNEYDDNIYSILPERIIKRWVHINSLLSIDEINHILNHKYIMTVVDNHIDTRPIFSLFTTCYKSYYKIFRAYNSIKTQTLKDWEWVILDDSPEDDHFQFLKNIFKNDRRIRLYKRSENSGSIGNVKNEAVLLCRGKYIIEMDHDDEILPDTLMDATNVFENDKDVGFVYMDFSNIYENGDNFSYGNFFALGYSGYYCQKHENKWINVAMTPNINNVTLSNIVSVPNHPRIWRKSSLMEIGNYSEFLPVSDDYELLLRTAVKTKIVKIPKLSYIQYMNTNNNNFSLIRNSEINRLCKRHLFPMCYEKYSINDNMKNMDAFEDPNYSVKHVQLWKRENYEYKYCNKIIHPTYKKQYCIIGLENFRKNKDILKKLYRELSNDFLLLDNKYDINSLTRELDYNQFDNMKCYKLVNTTDEELVKYFLLLYKCCDDYIIIDSNFDSETFLSNYLPIKNKITIITPCIRIENLLKIKESIDFDYVNQWIIVYDGKKIKELPNVLEKNEKILEFIHIGDGISGNPQRNFALDFISQSEIDTYLYFLDDDNIIHNSLYSLLNTIEPGKMYTFDQSRPPNVYPYKEILLGNTIEINNIDTAMLLIDLKLCKDLRWQIDKYNADGFYIKDCYKKNFNDWVYVNRTMSYYNKLI